jgi:hypothetical protein
MGYLVRVWCDDCRGEDNDGCFGGGDELHGCDYNDTPFASREDAEAYGREKTFGDAPWSFQVEEA